MERLTVNAALAALVRESGGACNSGTEAAA